MRTSAAVLLVLSTVLFAACARQGAVIEPAPAVAPVPQAPAPASAMTPPAPAPEPPPAPVPVAPAPAPPPPVINPTLEQADSLAANGQPDQARRVYRALLTSPGVPRATVAASARGLYRLGDYAGAVEAFRNLGTFSRGEEDLRYYNAVSLFETGRYADAKKELACALPYIEITGDVARYRDKIQTMPTPQAMKR